MAVTENQNDLLLAHLALELNFINAETLDAAKAEWARDKAKPMGQILVDRQAISPHTRGVLENLVQLQLAQDASKEAAAGDPTIDATLANQSAVQTAPGAPDQTNAPPDEEPTAATLRFHKLKAHAAGALGQVYLARDKELHRKVALKEIKEHYADNPDARSRFLLEGEITGRLEHPGVVPVYGMGTYPNGRPFYAMRFIQGESLEDGIKRLHRASDITEPGQQAMELRKLLGSFIAVCNTMQYAHDRDIVHRDLKPSNIMLGTYGETLVVDWGLAKVIGKGSADADSMKIEPMPGSGSSETLPGRAVGTLTYMSPEQAAGRLEEVGPLSDVYSLGATLFTLLTGKTSVDDSQAPENKRVDLVKIQRKVLEGKIRRPRQLKSDVDRALAAICTKAMALRPADRYASASAIAEDVERWLANEPVTAWREPISLRVRRWLRRHRTLVTSISVAFFVGVIGMIAFMVNLSQQRDALSDLNKDLEKKTTEALDARKQVIKRNFELEVFIKKLAIETKNAHEARDEAIKAQKQAAGTLALNTTMLAQSRWNEGQVVQANETLEQVPTDHRFGGWHFLRRQFEGSYATLYGHTDSVESVAYSPTGEFAASLAKGGEAILWDAQRGVQVASIGPGTALAFHPDRKHLVTIGTDGNVVKWALNSENRKATRLADTGFRPHRDEAVTAAAFSPDGKRFVTAAQDGKIVLCDAETFANPTSIKKGHASGVISLSFRPDGKRLASAGLDKSVIIWDPANGEELQTFTLSTNGIAGAAYSADSKHLVTVDGQENIKIWKADDPGVEVRNIKSRHASGITSVQFGPDGQWIATASFDGTVKIWNVQGSKEPITLQGHIKAVHSASFSPDGQRLVTAGSDWTVKLWDLVSGQEIQTFNPELKAVTCVAFDPDNSDRLASGAWNGTLKVWNASTGTAAWEVVKAHPNEILCVAFSPDGKRLASAGQDGKVRLCDASNGQETTPAIAGHTAAVTSIAYSHDGTRLASVSVDKSVKIWDTTSGEEVGSIKPKSKAMPPEYTCVSYSPDGMRLATADRMGTIKIWEVTTGNEVLTIQAHSSGLTLVQFNFDGELIATAGQDGKLTVWNARNGQPFARGRGHAGGIMSLSFSRDGKRLATASKDGTVKMWDSRSGQDIVTFHGHDDLVTAVAFSPDGTRIASASLDRTVKLWNAVNAEPVPTFKGFHGRPVVSVAFSANGKTIASRDETGKLALWSVEEGLPTQVKDIPQQGSPISPDGKKLALPFANWFYVIDLAVSKEDARYRERMSQIKPWWHDERAAVFEKDKRSYAAAFHLSWLVSANPDDAKLRERWDAACKGISAMEVETLRRQAGIEGKK